MQNILREKIKSVATPTREEARECERVEFNNECDGIKFIVRQISDRQETWRVSHDVAAHIWSQCHARRLVPRSCQGISYYLAHQGHLSVSHESNNFPVIQHIGRTGIGRRDGMLCDRFCEITRRFVQIIKRDSVIHLFSPSLLLSFSLTWRVTRCVITT